MTELSILEVTVFSSIWIACWSMIFAHTCAEINLTNLAIAFAPIFVLAFYFIFV